MTSSRRGRLPTHVLAIVLLPAALALAGSFCRAQTARHAALPPSPGTEDHVSPAADPLYDAFRDPDPSFGPRPLWFWNGPLDPREISRQIGKMQEQGIQAAFVHAREGVDPPYLSPGWWEIVGQALDAASARGFHLGFCDDFLWPSVQAGGAVVAGHPEFLAQSLRVERREDGRWSFRPEVRPGRRGTAANLLDRRAMDRFRALTYEAYAQRFPQHLGTTLDAFYADHEGDLGPGVPWVEGLEERFLHEKGYPLAQALPSLVTDEAPGAWRHRFDVHDVLSRLYRESFADPTVAWARARGVWVSGHFWESDLYREADRVGSLARMLRAYPVPGVDSLLLRGRSPREIAMAVSIAHAQGAARVSCENQGALGWTMTPEEMRLGTQALAAWGINLFVPHAFFYDLSRPEQPSRFPPSWFFRNPWWRHMHRYVALVRRLSWLQATGAHRAAIAVLDPIESVWASATSVFTHAAPEPALAAMERDYTLLLDSLAEHHLDFHILDTEALLTAPLSWDGGLPLGTERIEAIVVTPARPLRRAVLEKLLAFARGGGMLVWWGPRPKGSIEDGPGHAALPEDAFDSHPSSSPGELRVVASLEEVLDELDHAAGGGWIHPRLEVLDGPGESLRTCELDLAGRLAFLLVHDAATPGTIVFHHPLGAVPQVWNPLTGERKQPPFARAASGTTVAVAFDAWDARVLVLDPAPAAGTEPSSRTTRGTVTPEAVPADEVAALREAARPHPTRVVSLDPLFHLSPQHDSLSPRNDSPVPIRFWRVGILPAGVEPDGSRARSWPLQHVTSPPRPPHPRLAVTVLAPAGDEARPSMHRLHITIPRDIAAGPWWLEVAAPVALDLWFDGVHLPRPPRVEGVWRGSIPLGAILHPGENLLAVRCDAAPPGKPALVVLLRHALPGGDSTWIPVLEGWRSTGGAPRDWFLARLGDKAWDRGRTRGTDDATLARLLEGAPILPPEESRAWAWTPLPPGAGDIELGGVSAAVRGKGFLAVPLAETSGRPPLVWVRSWAGPGRIGAWDALGLRSFSGHIRYTAPLEAPALLPGERVILDLGDVRWCSEVGVNGSFAGERLFAPHRYDITPWLQEGRNTIEITVGNLLANRLLDDGSMHSLDPQRPVTSFERLRCGLLGPLRLDILPGA